MLDGGLLQSPSFENGGQPSLNGWGAFPIFDHGAPPGLGLSWSLVMPPAGFPPSTGEKDPGATQQFANLSSGVYRFSAWARSTNTYSVGHLTIERDSSGQWINPKEVNLAGSTWHQYTVTDTLTLLPSDTVGIILSGGVCEACPVTTLYTGVTFVKVH
jgi:hypothetical protein